MGVRPPTSTLDADVAGSDPGVDAQDDQEATDGEIADDVYDSMDPEETLVKVLPSPQRPSQKEVDEHNASHLPYRNWCPICVRARGREDAHKRIETRMNGKPIIVMDYKSFGANLEDEDDQSEQEKLKAIVMRDQETGMVSSHLVESKGVKDTWVIEKLVEDIADWGHADIVLKTDGEPAIVALQGAIREKRTNTTVPVNPPAYNPQSNGVAERAVQEVSAQFRCLKLALESRLKVPIKTHWYVLNAMLEHACYLINRCLRGSDGKVPVGRLRGYESSRPIIEFGEQVWAKPMRTNAWVRKAPLESKWAAGTWVGINPKTGEHLVILSEGGGLDESSHGQTKARRRTMVSRSHWRDPGIVEATGACKGASSQSEEDGPPGRT